MRPGGPPSPRSALLVASSGSHSCSAFCVTWPHAQSAHPLSRLVFSEKAKPSTCAWNQGTEVIYISRAMTESDLHLRARRHCLETEYPRRQFAQHRCASDGLRFRRAGRPPSPMKVKRQEIRGCNLSRSGRGKVHLQLRSRPGDITYEVEFLTDVSMRQLLS
jgi:hypothetical protein